MGRCTAQLAPHAVCPAAAGQPAAARLPRHRHGRHSVPVPAQQRGNGRAGSRQRCRRRLGACSRGGVCGGWDAVGHMRRKAASTAVPGRCGSVPSHQLRARGSCGADGRSEPPGWHRIGCSQRRHWQAGGCRPAAVGWRVSGAAHRSGHWRLAAPPTASTAVPAGCCLVVRRRLQHCQPGCNGRPAGAPSAAGAAAGWPVCAAGPAGGRCATAAPGHLSGSAAHRARLPDCGQCRT